MEYKTAKEMREISDKNSQGIKEILKKVEDTAKAGYRMCSFDSNKYKLSEADKKLIKDLGYNLTISATCSTHFIEW